MFFSLTGNFAKLAVAPFGAFPRKGRRYAAHDHSPQKLVHAVSPRTPLGSCYRAKYL